MPARSDPPLGHHGAPTVIETHMSVLFFYGERVLKVRKPVVYPFADLKSLSRRRADCEREVELNSRLAPDVYLGTVTLSLAGEPVEYGVLMRRLPAERSLEHLVRAGGDVGRELAAVAHTLASFHDRADRSARIDASATAAALWQRWQATGEALGRFAGSSFDRDEYRTLTSRARRFLDRRSDLFDTRIAQGAVCDGHGDLQASDIFCLPDGPRIIDCLEFDDELRYGDVLLDAAFLAEDLERLGAPDLADEFLEEYRRHARGDHPVALQHFYVAVRAHVRLLVSCLRLESGLAGDADEPSRVLRLADAHLRAALPRMVLVGGAPGTGKSTLARWIASTLDADVLSTDRLRAATGTAGSANFGDEGREKVYDEVLRQAEGLLRDGHSVVIDATWQKATLRERAADVARATRTELLELRADCPGDARRARVRARAARGDSESEATVAVSDALAAAEDPWPGAFRIDTSGTLEATRAAAATLLKVH